jgi:mRNA interferase RelE/StbE
VKYTVRILPRAEKQLESLDFKLYEQAKKKIYSLENGPRPPGCRKLQDRIAWSIRIGSYRVVYEIDDTLKLVNVLGVGHRKEIYRG